MTPRELMDRYVALHNQGKWDELGALFRSDAVLAFIGPMVGPFAGQDAIIQAFHENPPRDQLVILDVQDMGNTIDARYAWSTAPKVDAGTIRMVTALGTIAAVIVTVRA